MLGGPLASKPTWRYTTVLRHVGFFLVSRGARLMGVGPDANKGAIHGTENRPSGESV